MNFTENFLLYFDTYKYFANSMAYELIATNIDIETCEIKCEAAGGTLPQDFGMLKIEDIYISGPILIKYCGHGHLTGMIFTFQMICIRSLIKSLTKTKLR